MYMHVLCKVLEVFSKTVSFRIWQINLFKTFSSALALLVVRAAPSCLLRGAVARILYIYILLIFSVTPFSLV